MIFNTVFDHQVLHPVLDRNFHFQLKCCGEQRTHVLRCRLSTRYQPEAGTKSSISRRTHIICFYLQISDFSLDDITHLNLQTYTTDKKCIQNTSPLYTSTRSSTFCCKRVRIPISGIRILSNYSN